MNVKKKYIRNKQMITNLFFRFYPYPSYSSAKLILDVELFSDLKKEGLK